MMDSLPNYTKPLPDETLYSWMLRLARSNGLSREAFAHVYCGIKGKASIHPYLTKGFPELYKHLPFVSGMKDLFMSTSTMNFDLLSRTPSRQTQYFNVVLWPIDKLNTNLCCNKPRTKICPECMKEDSQTYGKPYFHRAHQLQGVCVCHKHHTPLLAYSGVPKKEIGFDMDDYAECPSSFPIEDSIAYAEYTRDLLWNDVHTDEASIRDAIEIHMKELGMDILGIRNQFIPYTREWKHRALMSPYDYQTFFNQGLRPLKNVSIPSLIPVIMCLWPNPKDFLAAVNDHEPILKEYVCQECGHTYLATPQSQRDGWGCPYCMQDVSIQERFDSLVQTIGKDEYECLTPFESLDGKITMKHIPCGADFMTTPSKFLFFNKTCSCCKKDPRKNHARNPGGKTDHIDLLETLDTYSKGLYEIIKLTNRDVVIKNVKTQQTFKMDISKFMWELQRSTPSPNLPLDPWWDASDWVPYWDKMLIELKNRLAKDSLDNIICETDEDDLFRKWLCEQLNKWGNGMLSEERKADLIKIEPHLQDYIPFSSPKQNKMWMRTYEIYKQYIHEHGKVLCTTECKERNLYRWKAKQRTKDSKGELSKHRHDLLLSADPHFFDA